MTHPRGRDQRNLGASATRPAALDPLNPPTDGDPTMVRWASAVSSRLDLREGGSGDYEAHVTLRELDKHLANLGIPVPGVVSLPAQGTPGSGLGLQVVANGALKTMSLEDVAAKFSNTTYFSTLSKRIDDPARFDAVAKTVEDKVLAELGTVATTGASAKGGDLTTTVAQAMAQIQSATTSSLRELSNASLGLTSGLSGQTVFKLSSGGALAGTGLGSTAALATGTTRAAMMTAGKFAIVIASDVLGTAAGEVNPITPPLSRIPFDVDADGVFLKAAIKISGATKASFEGINTVAVLGTFAVTANIAGAANSGMYGVGTSGAGVYGQTGTGTGVVGIATGAGNGVSAKATGGGVALIVDGPMTMTSTALVASLNADMVDGAHAGNSSGQVGLANGTVCTNLNAEKWNGATLGGTSSGASTATFNTTNKPGGASGNTWIVMTIAGVTYYVPAWT